ncbi:MAG: DUF4386 domain-containing protein [Actinomycetia bacterium]|nr:DUF4386 domain-containing protein [Actinomycetes bacterium]MCP4959778.1 DUF4386 domain-containing protein [Actinomycetes bacterium]
MPRPYRSALVGGFGYLGLFVLAIFANFVVIEGLVESDNGAATVHNISESMGLFRLGLLAFLGIFLIDVAVAWALHIVFRGHDHDLSLLAAWSRLVYTVLLGAALVHLFEVLQLVGGEGHASVLGREYVEAQVLTAFESFDSLWLIGLAVFGLHLVLLGVLVAGSDEAPDPMGWILVVAGIAYMADTVAHVALTDYSSYENLFLALVAIPALIGEGWMGLWLIGRFRAWRSDVRGQGTSVPGHG